MVAKGNAYVNSIRFLAGFGLMLSAMPENVASKWNSPENRWSNFSWSKIGVVRSAGSSSDFRRMAPLGAEVLQQLLLTEKILASVTLRVMSSGFHKVVNVMKSTLSENEFLAWVGAIAHHRQTLPMTDTEVRLMGRFRGAS